ncbi:ABC-F family ATP-binding cassette domain-containing protein [Myxococcota bacterium]|nr:ABC-F family ATP-binding cassette domain-containing protein [Myxococcota bacterium]
MLRFDDVSLHLGGRAVLDGVTFDVGPRDRAGLVGPNGAGKSTLLRVAAGLQAADGGQVAAPRGAAVGYLPQTGLALAGRSALDEVLAGVERLRRLGVEMEALLRRLDEVPAGDPAHAAALAEYERKEATFRQHGGYSLEADAARILRGLGFDPDAQGRRCETFSGGWQMRIALARLLLQAPDYLLLDEPTNHLDIEARTWLEGFLGRYPGAVVLVSHDRFFLDRVIGRVVEVRRGKAIPWAGDFTAWRRQREEEWERLRTAATRQQREIAEVERFVERFRYKASKAAQVQSRVKQLDKIERISAPEAERTARFRFPEPPRSSELVATADGLGKTYGEKRVLEGVTFELFRGDRVAMVGPNGAGKSTLMRLLAGREGADGGHRTLGHGVRIAYFAQDQADELKEDATVLAALAEVDPLATELRLRTLLGAFLFEGDDVLKPCRVLSGGERNRLALARVIARNANVLLLDEPTNHLDIDTKEMLEAALRAFTGTVVFVSHDRAFTTAVASKVLDVRGGGARMFQEGYEDFLWRRAREAGDTTVRTPGLPAPDVGLIGALAEAPPRDAPAAGPVGEGSAAAPPRAARSYEEVKKARRQREKAERRVRELMAAIEAKEAQVAALDERMSEPEIACDYARFSEIQRARDSLAREVEAAYAEWESLGEDLATEAGAEP